MDSSFSFSSASFIKIIRGHFIGIHWCSHSSSIFHDRCFRTKNIQLKNIDNDLSQCALHIRWILLRKLYFFFFHFTSYLPVYSRHEPHFRFSNVSISETNSKRSFGHSSIWRERMNLSHTFIYKHVEAASKW